MIKLKSCNNYIEKEVLHSSIRKTLQKEHLGKVNDDNEIVLDKRLRPSNVERIIKIPGNKDKNILGRNKSGTLIKTRKKKTRKK